MNISILQTGRSPKYLHYYIRHSYKHGDHSSEQTQSPCLHGVDILIGDTKWQLSAKEKNEAE